VRPPDFAAAANPRQRVRAAGLDPDHWYALEYDRALRPGTSLATRFWGRPIALWRDAAGQLHAADERRVPRDRRGAVLGAASALTGELEGYPVRARYGLVWIFPGDPERASQVPMPEVPELEGPDPWAYVPIDFTWRAHHSMVIDNLCDLTHAHLHRRFTSFHPGQLLSSEADGECVRLRYEARVGPLVRRRVAPSPMTICYEYPYHWASFEWSGIRGRIKYWTFLLPLDARTTRVFFVMMYDTLRVAALPVPLSHRAVRWLLRAAQPTVRSLLDQDGAALEAEQAGYEAQWAAPLVELNPAVSLLHRLTIRKWEAHLVRAPVAVEVLA
jgi:phenylpropionate dioxygenase-like ring-hydroxylating dioxygenase large terminal subunit